MRKRQLEKYRKQLLELRREILREIRHDLKEEREGEAADGRDTYDIASDERDREINLLLTDRERKKLLLVDDALRRVDSGEYGKCEECGEDIAEGRLEAMPFTRLCVTCQGEFEQAQRTMQAEAMPVASAGRISPATETDDETG
ncbi:MAG: TraR/DksA family transcriptional regulator [Deltaproteobacteria bacterium]|nr:MAG: TraR/DksA family transcriptional regulator [Deltaproteobacteria bacterium]